MMIMPNIALTSHIPDQEMVLLLYDHFGKSDNEISRINLL